MKPGPVTLDVEDIQGLVVRGYGKFEHARYLLLRVENPTLARTYLESLAPRLNTCASSPVDTALQLALTSAGLFELGVPPRIVHSFSREFVEGMVEPTRTVALGDLGPNAPEAWEWGQRGKEAHALLMVYARTTELLADLLREEEGHFAKAFSVLLDQPTITLDDHREHFGFRDGLSLPVFDGVPDTGSPAKQDKIQETWTTPAIKPGEFVLGYPNEYSLVVNSYTESPTAAPADDPHDLLRPAPWDHSVRDVGLNGSYLVYRQMAQDVPMFWNYLLEQSREPGADRTERAIALGTKLVGRAPSGEPLARTDPTKPAYPEENTFRYRVDDPFGTACPMGAHIRRANPRTDLAPDRLKKDESETMVRRHQMVRRGRPYGRPVAPGADPRKMIPVLDGPEATEPRGLHFICLVSHISRQFEFVQRAWLQSPVFQALTADGDPITGLRVAPPLANPNDQFTCPAVPVRRTYKGLKQFTTVVGGGYFFLPGIRTLQFLIRS